MADDMTKDLNYCVWTRLPDILDPHEVQPVQFKVSCNGLIARGVEPIYPDYCPGCSKPVKIAPKEAPSSNVVVYPTPWRLESRNDPIADTGDYDGVIAIKSADGKTITEAWNPSDDDVVAFQRIINVMNAHDSQGIHCVHCNGKGVETQHYDEETGWSDPDVPCETCGGSGRIRTVEQYLKTVPANWHEDSSVRTWFPLLDEEVARLRRAEASCNEHHAEIRPVETSKKPPHWTCKTHGDFDAMRAVGCPECMRLAREALQKIARGSVRTCPEVLDGLQTGHIHNCTDYAAIEIAIGALAGERQHEETSRQPTAADLERMRNAMLDDQGLPPENGTEKL